ncbi:MAG: response regulator [Pseudomonadota bacterium]
MTDTSSIQLLESRLKREKRARAAAERLLEEKASELWDARHELEKLLAGKTKEAFDAAEGRVAAEARLWDAISVLPGGFALYDQTHALLIANANYGQQFKAPNEVLIKGMSRPDILRVWLADNYPSFDQTDIQRRVDREAERWAARDLRQFDLEIEGQKWLRVTEKRISNGDLLHYFEDVTQERAHAIELDDARRAAEAASRAKSAFLANMSHEIRTPMNGVIGMADLLVDTKLSHEQRLYAQTIRNSGEALLVILNDILDYSKIEAGQMELFPAPFDLEATIHEALTLLQSKASDKGLDLLMDYDLFMPLRFIGDAGRIRQTLLNLIGNAIKFTDEGHVMVRVVGMLCEDDTFDIRIVVEDTGIGISEEQLTTVFNEFQQADQDTTKRFEGTGLGLAITRRLVSLMDGDVWVDSELGKGSSFGIKIMLPKDDVPNEIRFTEGAAKSGYTKALIVDDLGQNRLILEKQLSQCGIEVVSAGSVADALEVFADHSDIDMVLTDYLMPNATGVDLARALRKQNYKSTLVCLSSVAVLGVPDEDRRLFDHILQKPVLRRDIAKALGVVLGLETEGSNKLNWPDLQSDADTDELRLIIAEDNKTNTLVLKKMLKSEACDIRYVENGLELLEAYKDERPDAIITDISMPEMDGAEAIQEIRKLEDQQSLEPLPIVVLTAHAMAGDKASFLALGANGYLSKPIKKADLVAVLSDLRDGSLMSKADEGPSERTLLQAKA